MDNRNFEPEWDCVIIGGGPAGLTAAIYLARYHRKVVVIDDRRSRASYIKTSYNYPGFSNGIQGNALLENLRSQASEFGACLVEDRVLELETIGSSFRVSTRDSVFTGQKTILATGLVDRKPSLPDIKEFIYEGAVRFCPVCDGYEATDKKVGVMGPLDHILGKCLFISTYTKDLFVLPTDTLDIPPEKRAQMADAGIQLPESLVEKVKISENQGEKVAVILQNGKCIELDVLYPAMGADPRSDLAIKLGAGHNEDGCLFANNHQETSVPGLYIAGDLTTELSQISVATGQAAIAATDIHNKLPRNPRGKNRNIGLEALVVR